MKNKIRRSTKNTFVRIGEVENEPFIMKKFFSEKPVRLCDPVLGEY
jgi:hypothetical protein